MPFSNVSLKTKTLCGFLIAVLIIASALLVREDKHYKEAPTVQYKKDTPKPPPLQNARIEIDEIARAHEERNILIKGISEVAQTGNLRDLDYLQKLFHVHFRKTYVMDAPGVKVNGQDGYVRLHTDNWDPFSVTRDYNQMHHDLLVKKGDAASPSPPSVQDGFDIDVNTYKLCLKTDDIASSFDQSAIISPIPLLGIEIRQDRYTFTKLIGDKTLKLYMNVWRENGCTSTLRAILTDNTIHLEYPQRID